MAVLLSDTPRTRGHFPFPSRAVIDCVDCSEDECACRLLIIQPDPLGPLQ